MPRKKQAQPKHCQEEVDNLNTSEPKKAEDEFSTEPEELQDSIDNSQNIENNEDVASNESPSVKETCPIKSDKNIDKDDNIASDIGGSDISECSLVGMPTSRVVQKFPENSHIKRKSPDPKSQVLLPELVHPIKKELLEVESNSYDDAPDKRDCIAGRPSMANERQPFDRYFHYDQDKQLHKNRDAETEDEEEEDGEFKYRPPSSHRADIRQMEGDDASNGFSSPRSKVASPYRPRSNSSERSSNATGFRSHRSSSSFSSGSSRTATSPSYTAESHVNRLQSFVESLTTPVTSSRNKVTKEGRHCIQSPSLATTKAPACRDTFRNYECCTSKTPLVYRGSYVNSMLNNAYNQGEVTEEQPLDLSLKKYQHRPDRGGGGYDDEEGNFSGSASLLTLQSKFGENSPMLSSSNSKYQGVNFYNGLGYGFFKQTMYDGSKQKIFPQGSCNGFDVRSPSLSSSSSCKPVTNEISSLKQMISSCETGRPTSQTKLPSCYDPNKQPLKRPRSGTNERTTEILGDKNHSSQSQLPQMQPSDAKKAKPTLQDRRLEKLQKKKMQNYAASLRSDSALPNESSSLTSSETNQNTEKVPQKKVHTNQRCSCGVTYSNLFQLTVHVEETGHTPESLELDTAEDLPKLVRGQDVWISQGQEQTEMILRCIQCRTSFRSLPELTVHMVKTKHYINIVKADGDFTDPNNRSWIPKQNLNNDQQKPSSSHASSHTPTTVSGNNVNNSNNNNNNSPTSFKSGSQPDSKVEINHKSKNKTSDNENSSDKIKSDGKNSLKFGINEMLDFPSYKKMLKKMTENCQEIKPVDGVALTLFHNRLDQERISKQVVKGDVRHQPSLSGRQYTEESSSQKFESRSGNRNPSKSSISKPYQQDTTSSKSTSSLSDKYITPSYSFLTGKNLSSNDESESGECKMTNADKKSLELVSPLPYGVDGASSLKAMENFIESSFSKISQSLHTPSSLPFPSFASRCLITAPVLENVYNNAFLRDARISMRTSSNNSNCNKLDGKKRPLDQCQSSAANEDLLRKRKKLQSPHALVSTSQTFSQTSSGNSMIKNESTTSYGERLESRFTISSESSSTTDDLEYARQSVERTHVIKEEKEDNRPEDRSRNSFDLNHEKYLPAFCGTSNNFDKSGKSSTPDQTSYSNSLDSIKMLASKFFSSESPTRTFQQPSTPTVFSNRNREFYPDSYRTEYVARQGMMSNSVISDNQATYNHHHASMFEHHHHFDHDPPNLIRIKPEPQDDEDRAEEGHRPKDERKSFESSDRRGQRQEEGRLNNPQIRGSDDVVNINNNELLEEEEDKENGIIDREELDKTSEPNEDETSPLHLNRCQPSNFPINDSLSTTVRSCQQVQ